MPRRNPQLVVGRLLEHGQAPYQFRSGADPSYFVKVATREGPRTLWGTDLKRALRAATTQPKLGDIIGAQRIAREIVTVTRQARDSTGRVVSQRPHQTHFNRWRVEKIQFFAERAKLARQVRDEHLDARAAVRARPELRSTFLTIRAAEEYAARRFPDPKDRARFVEFVRGAMASSIRKGELLAPVRLRDTPKPAERKPSPARPRPRPRDDEPTR